MKKLLIITILSIALLLTACNISVEETLEDEPIEVQYSYISGIGAVYKSAQEMVDSEFAASVVIAKVTGISFKAMDYRDDTQSLSLEEAKKRYFDVEVEAWKVFRLSTIYDIEITSVLKGENADFSQIIVWSGIEDAYIEEQMAVVKEYELEFIPIVKGYETLDVGETYLFVLDRYKNFIPTPLSSYQGMYSLDDPFKKKVFTGSELENPPEYYYSRNECEYGSSPLISAYDIVSVFGDNVWGEFWQEWQRDNPDWETRIDRAAVEDLFAKRELR